MSHLDEVARRKVNGPEGWEVCGWERIGGGNDLVVEGGVPRLLKAGPKKGKKTWRDVPVQKAVVTGDELKAEHERDILRTNTQTLAMMLRKCAHRLECNGHEDLSADVVGLLRRYGLLGWSLRGAET